MTNTRADGAASTPGASETFTRIATAIATAGFAAGDVSAVAFAGAASSVSRTGVTPPCSIDALLIRVRIVAADRHGTARGHPRCDVSVSPSFSVTSPCIAFVRSSRTVIVAASTGRRATNNGIRSPGLRAETNSAAVGGSPRAASPMSMVTSSDGPTASPSSARARSSPCFSASVRAPAVPPAIAV